LFAGAVYETVAVLYAVAVAVPMVGAPGTDHVVMLFDAELDALLPAAFVAYTVNV
jgi:hypothetical protein